MDTKTLADLLRVIERSARDAIAVIEGDGGEQLGSDPTDASGNGELSGGWEETERLPDQSYSWPDGTVDHYDEIVVFVGRGDFAGMRFGIGRNSDPGRNGEVQVFVFGSGGGSARPLTVFVPADDVSASREFLSLIRGRDGGQKGFGPGEQLPSAYDRFNTAVLSQRIKGKWNRQAVVANEDDYEAMLAHTAIQARLRKIL